MQKRALQNNGKVAGFRHCNSNQTFNDLEVGTGAYDCLDGLSDYFHRTLTGSSCASNA